MLNKKDVSLIDEKYGIIYFINPDYEDAIIGISTDNRVVYSYDKMLENLVNKGFCETLQDAVEFIDFNVFPSMPYISNCPIIVFNENECVEILDEIKKEIQQIKDM